MSKGGVENLGHFCGIVLLACLPIKSIHRHKDPKVK